MRLNSFSRPKFLSTSQMAQEWLPTTDLEADEDVFSNKDAIPCLMDTNNKLKKAVEIHNALNKLISLPEDCSNEPEKNEDQIERSTKDYLSELEESENRRRNRRYLKRENRMQRNQRSRNDGVSKMIPSKNPNKSSPDSSSSSSAQSPNVSAIAAAEKLEYLESIHTKNDKSSPVLNTVSTEKEPTSESPQPKNGRLPSAKTNLRKSESLKNIPTEADIGDHVTGLRRYHSFKGSSSSHRKLKTSSNTSSLKRTKSSMSGNPKATSTPISTKPTVSAITPLSSNVIISDPIVISEENTKEGTFTRTGWLFRQTLTKDWSKHWFVLKDSSLTYYRDPSAEHCGIMDGILDLNQVSTIQEQDSDKFYAISLRMWDGKKHVLATETEEFRSMWITALQYASNLWSSASKEDFICTEIILPEHTYHQNDRSDRISSPSSLLSLSFAEDNPRALEYSSYSSDDQSEYFSLVDEDEISDLSSSPRTLPPSPPINRNVISLVKEKSRTRCNYAAKPSFPQNEYGGTTCHTSFNKNADNQLNDDLCNKFQDFIDTGLPIEADSVFLAEPMLNGEIIRENEIPTSPITPPVEFMNIIENKLENQQANSSKLKLSITEGCSTCISIRAKLLTAQEEIKKLEKELKEAHASFDNLEMFSYKLTQDMKLKEENYNSQIALMTAKIDDLTSKFTFSEKNFRQLKQKILKNEGKERRRSSLKNKEGLSLTKEYETKLCELEKKIGLMEIIVKRDLTEAEMSENSLSDTSSRLSESCVASESSETNTPTEPPISESKGFFSRLQSLMSKVDTVSNTMSVKDDFDNVKNPKILLPTKNTEELTSLDESDEWQVHPSNNCNSPTPDKFISPSYPKNLAECQIMLSQKLNDHFRWLKQSLDFINKQEKNECQSDKIQSILVNNLAHELNDLHEDIEIDSLNKQKLLFLFEVEKIIEKIKDEGSTKSRLKINSVESTYNTIFQTLCITFAEYENSDFTGMLVSDIPQFHFFCPPSNKLLTPIPDDFEDSSRISERITCLESQLGRFLDRLTQAKRSRYDNLWDILADVPVQDDHINKPVESNSVLNCITFIATDIHHIAELQLSNVPKATSYISKDEYLGAQKWFDESSKTLKDGLNDFLSELKDKCPMVNESTVSFYKLNETIRTDIIKLVVELSFLNICYLLLRFLTNYFTYVDEIREEQEQSSCLLKEKWLSLLKQVSSYETNLFSANTFQCSQCRLLTDLFHETESRVNWLDFVQKYNNYNLRKVDKHLKYESHLLQASSSASTCANCDDKLQSKNQKDVCNNVTCAQCDSWIQKFCAAEKQHELEQRTLEVKHNAEVKQLEECIIKSSEIHEQELLQKQNELAAVTSQLHRLKTEYEGQKQILRNFYEEKLNFECENISEENIKDTYRLEIEDLKDMFKKGLAAIENSHNRITSEMERRHSEEISLLEAEKQRALEVEAQATFTALEAIKKSHAQQLQEETALIKKDLMNKFQVGDDCDSIYGKYGVELGKLKTEIMKITEMYSSKCLENVALEEKVNSLRQQLKEAHNELCNLLSKNKEISASLFGK